jgi:hypothetical protein
MTLVLSEVSKFGVVMVADSAITTTHPEEQKLPSGEPIPKYVRLGSAKIKQVQGLPIGISFYGMGRIGGIPTDVWMDDFLSHNIKVEHTLDDICNILAKDINEAFFRNKQNDLGGFHVGAVLEPGTENAYPILYHIFRGDQKEAFHLQKDNPDGRGFTPQQWRDHLQRGYAYYLRTGLHEPFAVLQQNIFESIYALGEKYEIQIPHPPGLSVHERFDRLQVGLMCDLVAMSNHTASVGRPISSLTISLNGHVTFSSALNDVSYV